MKYRSWQLIKDKDGKKEIFCQRRHFQKLCRRGQQLDFYKF